MLESIFSSILSNSSVSVGEFLICLGVSLVLGFAGAALYMFKNNYSKGFAITLALLPAIVQVIITMVNGELGAGIAVAGAFTLVRFRSVPGGAREICSIFLAMAIGLATGMGYVWVAVIFLAVIAVVTIILVVTPYGESKTKQRQLTVEIPESLDYTDVFDDLFEQYTAKHELVQVKTTNMGALYKLKYEVTLRNPADEKKFIDDLRCRNGNLAISIGRVSTVREEL